jgi:hypothetical protein
MVALMRVLRWLGFLVLALVAVGGAIIVAARFSDGPMGLLAGGPLVAGELVSGAEPDWTFAKDIPTIEFQLLEPARSRTTWILEHEGRVYIPCGYMESTIGRLWKRWPIEAERDGRAIIRVDGKRYERQLVRIKGGPIVEALTAEINRKYRVPATAAIVAADSLWLFELKPRA